MSSSLIRGKYIIGRVIDNDRAEVIEEQRRQIARDVYGHVEAFYRGYLG